MKNHKKTSKTIIALASLCLTSAVTFTVAFTTAAFINAEIHKQTITIDTDYSQYFSNNLAPGAIDTEAKGSQNNPYYIETGKQLRNLSYLVNLGVFDETHYFTIPDTFNYIGDAVGNEIIPLTPIGTDQFPFRSNFIGRLSSTNTNGPKNKCPIISNLYVKGENQGDVGMFGYIDNSGYVGQFILQSPKIISGDSSKTYGPTAFDNNPIRDLKLNGQPIFNETMLNGINITNPVMVSKSTNRMSGFDIEVPLTSYDYDLIAKNETNPDGSKLQFQLYHEVSDNSLIQSIGETKISGGVKFSFKNPTTPLTPPSSDPSWTNKPTSRVKIGKYVTISIGVKAVVNDPSSNTNYFSSYILERFKVFYEYQSNAYIIDDLDARTYDKLIHPKVTYQEDVDDNGNSAFEKFDETRALYVGIIAGRCDGTLDAIGVIKPRLDISRPFISKSLLVGKTIDDDNKKTMMKESFTNVGVNLDSTFLTPSQNDPEEKNGLQGVVRYMYNYNHWNKKNKPVYFPNADGYAKKNKWYEHGNRFVKPIYSQCPPSPEALGPNLNDPANPEYDSTTGYAELGAGMDYVAQNNIRIFGKNIFDSKAKDGLSSHEVNVYTVGQDYDHSENPEITGTTSKVRTISLSAPMRNEFIDQNPIVDTTYRGFNNIYASNSMYFWVTSKHNRGRQRINGNGALEFYLDIEIDYLYFDDTNNNDAKGEKSNIKNDADGFNKLTVDVAERAIGRKYHSPFDDSTIKLRNAYCGPTVTKPIANSDGSYTQYLDKVPYYNDAPKGPTSSNYKSIYPFAFVKPEEDPNDANNKINPLVLRERSGTLSEADSGKFKVLTKKISIDFNNEFIRPKNVNWQVRKAFFPCFYIGFPESTRTDYRFDILGIKVLLSNKKGNTDSSIGAIDFLDDNATTLPVTSTAWNFSKTKVGAKTIANTTLDVPSSNDASIPSSTGSFVQVYSACLNNNQYGISHYLIDVSRTSKGVKVSWNIQSNINFKQEDLDYIKPKNAEGYTNKVVDETQSSLLPISLTK